ncbi:MAG: UvrD-helicase domain-containing protein [Gammaproteobacteria bacterium]|nr:UvrD-helicase domain-containing protein [Gammaproteobacteria bacterium]
MSESPEHLDALARTAATDPARSVLLEAPAGSGKTSVLTRRFLELLRTVEEPGEILAITFTRKAAAEMQARVIRALRGEFAANDAEAAQLVPLARAALAHGATRGWRLDSQPQSLRIQTIDAFNFWLASQLPVASRAGGVLQVTESAAALYQRAARRTLVAADTEPALLADARLLFERTDNHWMYLERLIAQMLEERSHWLPFVAREEPEALCRRVNESLANLTAARLASLCALIPAALRQRAQSLAGGGPLGCAPEDLPHWKHLAHLLFTKDDWRRQLSAHRLGPAFSDTQACQRLRDLIDELRRLPGAREALLALRKSPPLRLGAEDAAAIGALARILSRAAAELHAEFAQAQRVDYTYVTGAAREALSEGGEPTDLALRAGLALRHILVDEFQDTSLAQVQLLEALTIGWEEGDGRTLFVVGDAMQSIYRFRGAEVGLFLRARTAGIGALTLQPLRLLRNFRAVPALVEFTNEVFAQVFPALDEPRSGAVSYRPSIASVARTPARIAPVSLKLYPQGAASEARAVAEHIAHLRELDPTAKVAVLVVAHAHAVPIVEALTARAVPSSAVDLVPLRERLVVRDLVQLGCALFDLSDRTAWLAVLRAPWCGVSLRSLTALSGPNDRELIFEALTNAERLARCDPSDLPRLARVQLILGEALAERGEAGVADWLERTWLRLGASDAYEACELEDGRSFFAALAARCAALEWRDPRDFAALLDHLYSAPRGGENPVQVMTVHRAKGLEFEHVIVPALQRATRGAERRLLRWIDLPGEARESDLLISPSPPVGAAEDSELNIFIKDLIRQRDAHERSRLLYVAATRARRTLWLSAAPARAADGSVKPDRRSMLALLWPALGSRFETVESSTPPVVRGTAGALARLKEGWQPAPVSPALQVVHLPRAYLATEPVEFSWVRETQRDIGTVVHAWLLRLAQERPLRATAELEKEREAVLAQLARLGVPQSERTRASDLILRALGQTLSDARGRWILDGAHRDPYSEWELSGVTGGRLRNVRIDRSFIDESGTRWVIDYKISSHEGGDLEGFLAQELERYRPQLAGYVELARAVGEQPVRAALYFPLLGAFREMS